LGYAKVSYIKKSKNQDKSRLFVNIPHHITQRGKVKQTPFYKFTSISAIATILLWASA